MRKSDPGHAGTRKSDRDRADLTSLPFLTTRRVCILADCVPSTVTRSPLVPVGRRGRTKIYATADVMRWITGELGQETASRPEATTRAPTRSSSPAGNDDALARIRRAARGETGGAE